MGAGRGVQMQRTRQVPTGSNLVQSVANDAALSGLELVDRSQLAGQHVFREVLDCGQVLAHEIKHPGRRLGAGS